jgi:tetratricopeptide (TPR) repeat protein
VTSPDGPDLRRDPVAAVTVAAALSRAAVALGRANVPPGDEAYDSGAVAADAATRLVPRWTRAWLVLATTQERAGALQAAWDAASRAGETAPRDVDALATGVRISLHIGNVRFAAAVAESLLEEEAAAAKAEGRRPRAETLLLFARAASADGAARIPDPLGGTGVRFRYEVAIAVLRDLIERREMQEEARELLYRTCLHYGDLLASLDRTALALLAYQEATRTGVRDAEAAEHLQWLVERLRGEERDAGAALDRARRGEGNVAEALVQLARSFSRQARWKESAEVFRQLERDLGMTPALRYLRAIHVYRETEPARAVEELRTVVKDEPGLARGHYELARLLEEAGDYAAALESYRESRRLATEQAATGGAEEWLLDADERFDALEQILREQAGAR